MSRRDTIIIAVLVNAGLLMVLFATALKSDHKKRGRDSDSSYSQLVQAPQSEMRSSREEEVLKQYTMAQVPTLGGQTQEIVLEDFPIQEIKPVEVVAKPPSIEKNQAVVSVSVKKGDFLEKIAKANNTSVAAIMKENNLSSTQLKVGQLLRIPVRGDGEKIVRAEPEKAIAAATPVTAPTAAESAAATEYYVVKEGDNPWLIASKNRVRLEDLLRINGLDEQKARRLRPGDRLKIR